jgi:hypothetical protein
MTTDADETTTETASPTPAPAWWRAAAPEDFRARVATMPRAEREVLHAEMNDAIGADQQAISAALAARKGLADIQNKWLTLGALTAATAFDAKGNPVGPIKK